MSRPGSASKIKLSGIDELLGGSIADAEQVVDAKLDELHTFKNHPFRVLDDEKMEETAESIGKYGVLVPGIARPMESGG